MTDDPTFNWVARKGSRPPGIRRSMLLAMLCVGIALTLVAWPTRTRAVPPTSGPVTGNATYFDGLGAPYGGCGMPQASLDSQDFVALNVFNTPGDYGAYPRPIPASLASKIGLFDNGLNCGRYVQVTIGDYCTGINDGAQNQPFCRNGSWVADAYDGATLTMLVADSCGDSNAWCRDDPYHLDLHKDSLNRFVKNGAAVGDMYPGHWNNRHISWQFVQAPSYAGDIQIGFLQGGQVYWPAISISHLQNGIHGVQYLSGGGWQDAKMNSDMGQSYIIGPTTAAGSQYEIRVTDASDTLINGGRVYDFRLPSSCNPSCGAPYTQVSYTTGTGPTASPTVTPSSPGSSGSCTATSTVTNSWTGGYQAQVYVIAGSAPISGWTTSFTLPAGDTVASSWDAVIRSSGQTVTASNAPYNGSLSAGASTTWGMVVNGPPPPAVPLSITCA